ncbi:uncharacterized protein LOC117231911 isoform X2 [Bombus vosnesenskii]|uniref:Uncharacterized protein LOC117231911 isoform X2 n=4 Tax=Bombus TaxID=28641 RepID=A0A6J3K103_9HYME|nr:uncharacterized protein LOC100645011 isoform X4 [Bombus terrestris]XP_012250344.1 uncharacterized protein LOC100741610 isoform X4 [Bombus impatiens]XP_033202330.1 uncharacterized protein LOC117163772 isoform X4 [Bombus vancouverensis nearcticus]XP_033298697.1 uncharacterized protein LOC117204904 isoform X4 [Bombus bifarius]XP_033346747.1 uncharacterized protein LOC117231911 isoform X2 [Bombus vosnesenskii]XP_043590687.1 uncharacterized protein LOC122571234 isoform X4 [Bombus pyrosoma]XP_05
MLEFSVQHAEVALSTATEDVGDGIQGHDNDTDPPVDSVYMICGVLIALLLVGVIIVLLAVTISKLRKREDHSNAVHPEATVVQTATSPVSTIVEPSYPGEGCCTQTSVTTTSTDLGNSTAVEQDNVYATVNPADQFVWQFPPPYPPPHTPTQYTLYNDQDTLVHALPSDRPGFAKGFRKNIGGRWRRLVKRKPETETCAIPPELKDQLKTIYVY